MVVMGRVGHDGGAQHDEGAWHGRAYIAWPRAFHFVIPRAVAESSHPGLKPFCDHFLDAATARSMTGGARSMTGARSVEFESRNGCRLKVQY